MSAAPLPACAEEPGTNEYLQILDKLDDAQKSVKNAGETPGGCDWSGPVNCSYDFFCSKLRVSDNGFYLYHDKEGHQVPNFPLSLSLNAIEACLGNPLPKGVVAAIQDPFVYPELFSSTESAGGSRNLQKNTDSFVRQAARIKEIFEDSKKHVIQVLEKRRTPENSDQISNMITRVKTVALSPLKPGQSLSSLAASGCDMPNAYYRLDKHQVIACPQILNFPDATLFGIIAHELGHSIDPCATSFSYTRSSDGKYFLNETAIERSGSEPASSALPSIPTEQTPFNNIFSCLESRDSVGAKTPSREQILNFLDAALAKQPSDQRLQKSQELIDSHYEQTKFCSFLTGSQMQEAAADWMGSQALAEKLSKIRAPEKAKSYAFESQLLIMSLSCPNVKQSNRNTLRDLQSKLTPLCSRFKAIKQALLSDTEITGDPHPKAADRLNRIIYVKPEIQQALGCRADPKTNGKECK
jgi:hypothetical protein